MLARVYNSTRVDPKGWYASEKFDGIRAHWCGKEMRTRQGFLINLPKYITSILPTNRKLDGELWFGRNRFELTGLLRRDFITAKEMKRQGLKFMVFDIIDEKMPVEKRQAELREICKVIRSKSTERVCPVRCVTQTKVKSEEHMKQILAFVVAKGGEGLMLLRPYSRYECKRTNNLLKVKPLTTSQGVVTGYKDGVNGIGSLAVRFKNVDLFVAGLSNTQKSNAKTMFPIGSTLDFSYNELTHKGVPRHPRLAKTK
jgi:DNA ligase-1